MREKMEQRRDVRQTQPARQHDELAPPGGSGKSLLRGGSSSSKSPQERPRAQASSTKYVSEEDLLGNAWQQESGRSMASRRRSSGVGAGQDKAEAIALDDEAESSRLPPKSENEVHQNVKRLLPQQQQSELEHLEIRTRRVLMGKVNFGPARVTFLSDKIQWMPAENYQLPDGTYPLVSIPTKTITRFEVDKVLGGLCIWAMYDPPFMNQLEDKYAPHLDTHNAESSIYIEYDTQPYKAGKPSWPSDIVKLVPRLKTLARFQPEGEITGRRKSKSGQRASQVVPSSMRTGGGASAKPSRGTQNHAASSNARSGVSHDKHHQQQLTFAYGHSGNGSSGSGSYAGRSGSSSRDAYSYPPSEPSDLPQRRLSRRLNSSNDGGKAKVLLVFPNEKDKDTVTLTTEEIMRLSRNDFLNDSLVDYELKVSNKTYIAPNL